MEHCLFSYVLSFEVGNWLLETVQKFFPLANAESVINLNLSDNTALLWIAANTLHFVWNKRSSKKKVSIASSLANLKVEALKLDGTHHSQLAAGILEILESQSG